VGDASVLQRQWATCRAGVMAPGDVIGNTQA
jgi:hypothetical protein